MSTTRMLRSLGLVIMHGVVYSGLGALDGAIGSDFMRNRHYPLLECVRTGAAGGALVGTAMGLYKEIIHLLDQRYHFLKRTAAEREKPHLYPKPETLLAEMVFSLLSMPIAGALGHAMLLKMAEMSLAQAMVALLAGASVMTGVVLLLVTCGFCYMCLESFQQGFREAREEQRPSLRSY